MTDHVWRRLQLIYAQGMAKLIGHQKVQARVLSDEVLPNLDRVEPYGFSYRPKPGAECYLLFPSGDRSYGVAIVIGDKQYNMQLEEGEVALHDDEGNYVHLKRGGNIEVNAKAKITARAPEIEALAETKITLQAPIIEATAETSITLAAPQITLDTPQTTLTGNIAIAGNATIAQGLAILGGGGAGATITGTFDIQGSISCNGKDIGDSHTHSGVYPGDGTTGGVS